MIKILAIGNSFSQDATAYLAQIAKADEIELKVVNLYIGGCSLETHWKNIEENTANYEYELNGVNTGRKVTIQQTLQEEAWDFITLQQASYSSGILDSYYPFIKDISNYVKEYVPFGKQLIHQTWAYEVDSTHFGFLNYDNSQERMYQMIRSCYDAVAKDLELDMIPSGRVIQELRKYDFFDYVNGGQSLCRDGFHMNLLYGRYATAATWYQFIVQNNIIANEYVPTIIDRTEIKGEVFQLIKNQIHRIHQEFSDNHK